MRRPSSPYYPVFLQQFSITLALLVSGAALQSLTVASGRCYCGIPSRSVGQLRCSRSFSAFASAGPDFQPVTCRVFQSLAIVGGNRMKEDIIPAIAPWGLSGLTNITTLQLQVQRVDHLGVQALAGLNSLTDLVIQKGRVAIQPCALAHLPKISRVVFNCKMQIPKFISFRHPFHSLRVVDCRWQARQFYCVRCSQNPSIFVVRARSGPKSRNYVLAVSGKQCYTQPCSNEEMCYGNKDLDAVLYSIRSTTMSRPTTVTTTTTITTLVPTTTTSAATTSITKETTTLSPAPTTVVVTTPQVIDSTSLETTVVTDVTTALSSPSTLPTKQTFSEFDKNKFDTIVSTTTVKSNFVPEKMITIDTIESTQKTTPLRETIRFSTSTEEDAIITPPATELIDQQLSMTTPLQYKWIVETEAPPAVSKSGHTIEPGLVEVPSTLGNYGGVFSTLDSPTSNDNTESSSGINEGGTAPASVKHVYDRSPSPRSKSSSITPTLALTTVPSRHVTTGEKKKSSDPPMYGKNDAKFYWPDTTSKMDSTLGISPQIEGTSIDYSQQQHQTTDAAVKHEEKDSDDVFSLPFVEATLALYDYHTRPSEGEEIPPQETTPLSSLREKTIEVPLKISTKQPPIVQEKATDYYVTTQPRDLQAVVPTMGLLDGLKEKNQKTYRQEQTSPSKVIRGKVLTTFSSPPLEGNLIGAENHKPQKGTDDSYSVTTANTKAWTTTLRSPKFVLLEKDNNSQLSPHFVLVFACSLSLGCGIVLGSLLTLLLLLCCRGIRLSKKARSSEAKSADELESL